MSTAEYAQQFSKPIPPPPPPVPIPVKSKKPAKLAKTIDLESVPDYDPDKISNEQQSSQYSAAQQKLIDQALKSDKEKAQNIRDKITRYCDDTEFKEMIAKHGLLDKCLPVVLKSMDTESLEELFKKVDRATNPYSGADVGAGLLMQSTMLAIKTIKVGARVMHQKYGTPPLENLEAYAHKDKDIRLIYKKNFIESDWGDTLNSGPMVILQKLGEWVYNCYTDQQQGIDKFLQESTLPDDLAEKYKDLLG
jgi:hypothetical protein